MSFSDYLANFFKDSSSGVFTEENYPNLMGRYNVGHLIFLGIAFLTISLLCYFLRKTEPKKILNYLRVSAIVWIALEIFKMGKKAYYQFDGLSAELPVQLCSLFLYALPLAGWGRGTFKKVGEYFLVTNGIIFGLMGLLYPSIFSSYPIIHFNGLHSMVFHAAMLFTGFWLICTKYVKLESKKFYLGLILIYPICAVAITVNELISDRNYIYLKTGDGTPFAVLNGLPHAAYVFVVLFLLFVLNALLFLPLFIKERRKKEKEELFKNNISDT